MNEIIFDVVQCAVVVIMGTITKYVIPWVKTKLDREKLETAKTWVSAAVNAAEQVIQGELKGKDRKEYVIEYLLRVFESNKIKMSEDQLDILIESAVKELNSSK